MIPTSAATILTVLCLLQPASPTVAVDTETSLDARAAEARERADAPALGVVVWRAGEEPIVAVDGVRVVGLDARVTKDDLWHWGSITKSITATVVARLVEKEVVDWEDTIEERLGDLVPNMHDEYRDATFVHLLSHRSGLRANIPIARFAEFHQPSDDPIADRLKWVQIALNQEPKGPKGTTNEYSNNGYIVAAAMLEAATGTSMEELTRREVFEPLDMKTAGFGPPRGDEPDSQPRGHTSRNGTHAPVPIHADNPPALGPAGRVHMSLGDMARFLSAHANRRAGFLDESAYERLHTPPFGGTYAYGWVVTGPEERWHNGSNTMWYAEAAINLNHQTVAAVVVNDGDIRSVQPAVRSLLQSLMEPVADGESASDSGAGPP